MEVHDLSARAIGIIEIELVFAIETNLGRRVMPAFKAIARLQDLERVWN